MSETIPIFIQGAAWAWLAAGGLSALIILGDIFVTQRRVMPVMAITWPVTALYMGPFAVWAYWKMGRMPNRRHGENGHEERPFWVKVFVSSCHCGAGCTLGDILSDTLIFVFSIVVFSSPLLTSYIFDFIAAYIFGLLFQYFPIRMMRGLPPLNAMGEAIKADTISLIAFELGLFFWMGLVQLLIFQPRLEANDPVFWFMMQVGMCLGFLTTYPANWLLVRRGVKEAM